MTAGLDRFIVPAQIQRSRTIPQCHCMCLLILNAVASDSFFRPRHSQNSYYDDRMRQGASLVRARRPYIVPNALTGIGLFAFVISVCQSPPSRPYLMGDSLSWHSSSDCTCHRRIADGCQTDSYTIKVIAQDEFEDVPVPPAEPALRSPPPTVAEPLPPTSEVSAAAEAGGWANVKKWFS